MTAVSDSHRRDLRVEVVTPRIESSPGELTAVEVRITNEGSSTAHRRARVVGFDAPDYPGRAAAERSIVVGPGQAITTMVPIATPDSLGIGEHAVALELVPERPGERPLLVPFTVSIGSVERVELTPLPERVRGRRRGRLRVDVANFEPVPVDVALGGESPTASIRFRQPRRRLAPGERSLVTGRVKGPRLWFGEPTQHPLVITATGRAASTSTTAVFVQRPLFAHRLRGALIGLTVIAVWLAALGGVGYWWSQRDDAPATAGSVEAIDTDGDGVPDLYVDADGNEVRAVDTDGDGIPDLFVTADGGEIQAIDTDGDGIPDLFVDEDGNRITGVDTDGDGNPDTFYDEDGNEVDDPRGGSTTGDAEMADGDDRRSGSDDDADSSDDGSTADRATSTIVRGTVTADGSVDDVSISLSPIALTDRAAGPAGTGAGGAGVNTMGNATEPPATITKIWSARRGLTTNATLGPIRQTEPVTPLTTRPGVDGVWLFADVALRQTYEVVFAKPGFNTKSFVVAPPDDGSPVELEVELEPADGAIVGSVVGPDGPLGGVAIAVTDGTLDFETTSSTVDSVGSWSLENVSSPGVYTVTATRRGYGTEVIQVELEPGERATGADISMRPGVGSINGRVLGSDGQPLGGVAITADNGETSRTTTSLTDGDIGSFHLPQLDVDGVYTVRAELDGYLTQSRRLAVPGAVAGVDFDLTASTLRLTGRITSENGGGIRNAGLTLSVDDLTFKAQTAAATNPGTFAIDDLPPGSYTVTIEHYQHITSTQSITLTAGIPPPPLNVELVAADEVVDAGRGTLVVEVVDPAGETAEEREIAGATVQLVHTRTGDELAPLTQQAFDFRIEDIPVGTYTLLVSAPRYNDAAPRQVSIGRSEERVQVELTQLGQASGRVVDSMDGSVLTDYYIDLYRQPEAPGDEPVFRVAADPNGTWRTQPATLVPGIYRIDIPDSGSPVGYIVRDDQLLDPNVEGAGIADRQMRFEVRADGAEPITIPDLEADRLPHISGRVYRPRLDAATTSVIPLDDESLDVTFECADGNGPVDAPRFDLAGVTAADGTAYDSFELTPEQVDAGNTTGDCTVRFSADGYADTTASMPAVDASDGTSPSDRRIHAVLARPAPEIGGRVFWMDGGTQIPLAGVDVTAAPFVDFPSRESDAPSNPPAPVSRPLDTTSSADGSWQLDGQVFGNADYVFDADHFAPGAITITVDDHGETNAAAAYGAIVTESDGRFDVELAAATPRDLTGTITVLTTGSPNWPDFEITATDPTGSTITRGAERCGVDTAIVRGTPAGTSLPFTICNARPGTWSVTVSQPDHHEYYGDPPPASQLVSPGDTAQDGFDIALAELASFELRLLDSGGSPLPLDPSLEVHGTATVDAPIVRDGHVSTVTDLPVADTDPHLNPTDYSATIDLPGYDLASAVVTDGQPADADGRFPFSVRAGDTAELELEVPRYGSISGRVVGAGTGEVIDVEQDGTLTATRVTADGTPIGGAPPVAVDLDGNEFSVSGPHGYYRIEVTHPNFTGGTPPDDVGTFDPPIVDDTNPVSTVDGVFRIANEREHLLDDWKLDLRPGVLDLSVFTTLEGAPSDCDNVPTPVQCVDGATYRLTPTTTSGSKATDTISAGHAIVTGLAPGSYRLEVRRYAADNTTELNFPAIVTISIGRSTGDETAVTTVRAPLPEVAPSVHGSIVAHNGADPSRSVPLPDIAYTVTSAWNEPDIEITTEDFAQPSGTIAGTVSEPGEESGDRAATIDDAGRADGAVEFTLDRMPFGVHRVTLGQATIDAAAAAGYQLAGDATRDVTVAANGEIDIGALFEFVVDDVDVVVDLGADNQLFEIGSAALTWNDDGPVATGATVTYGDYQFDAATNTITFPAVAPELGTFSLAVTSALHDDLNVDTVAVPPAAGDEVAPDIAPMTPSLARLGGAVFQETESGETSSLGANGRVELRTSVDADADGQPDLAACPNLTSGTCALEGPLDTYEFDVGVGTYDLRVTQTGYPPYSKQIVVDADKLATMVTADVTISKLARYSVSFDNADELADPVVKLVVGSESYPLTREASSDIWAGSVPAGTYQLSVSGSGYPATVIGDDITLTIGGTDHDNLSLVRYLTVSMAGQVLPTRVTVTAGDTSYGSYDFEQQIVLRSDNDSLPPTGPVVLTFERANYRTRQMSATYALNGSITANLYTATGFNGQLVDDDGAALIDAALNGTTLTATAADDDAVVITDTLTSNGQYEILGLTNQPDGSDRDWLITYDVFGVGAGSSTVSVKAVDSAYLPTFTVTERDIMVTFNVTAPGGFSTEGLVVELGDLSDTVTSGVASFTIPESTTGDALEWSIAGTGDLETASGMLDPLSVEDLGGVSVPVSMIAVPPPTTVAPTTVPPPTTVAPTTVPLPTTVAPTTVAPTTVATASSAP